MNSYMPALAKAEDSLSHVTSASELLLPLASRTASKSVDKYLRYAELKLLPVLSLTMNFDIFDLATHCYIENLITASYNATKNFISPIIAHTEFLDGFARDTVHWLQDNKPRRNPLINTCDMSS
jgi:hypothetical protein